LTFLTFDIPILVAEKTRSLQISVHSLTGKTPKKKYSAG